MRKRMLNKLPVNWGNETLAVLLLLLARYIARPHQLALACTLATGW